VIVRVHQGAVDIKQNGVSHPPQVPTTHAANHVNEAEVRQ
jgi:hypothetical protein